MIATAAPSGSTAASVTVMMVPDGTLAPAVTVPTSSTPSPLRESARSRIIAYYGKFFEVFRKSLRYRLSISRFARHLLQKKGVESVSVHLPGRCGVRKLLDCSCDPAPGCGALRISLGLQLISSGRALLESLIAVASEHESCGPPDVDFGDHEYTGVTCRRLYVWMYISTNQLSLSGKPIIQQAVYEGGEVPALLLILKTPANSPFDGFSH